MNELGKWLIEQRLDQNITQKDLANRIGITQAMLCAYEQGKRVPGYSNINKIADYFDVRPIDIRRKFKDAN